MVQLEPLFEERALRADARRNLDRIVAAAREVFAELGAQATVADVAARAGVGTATIFRRFPTKDELLLAVVEERLREIVELVRLAARSDPGKGFRRLMTVGVEAHIGDRGFCEAAASPLFNEPPIRALAAELTASIEEVLRRAQEAGEVRADVTAHDLSVLVTAVGQAGLRLEPAAGGVWRRYLDIVLDGLRPEGARPLSRRAPSEQQLDSLCRLPSP
jgi:AcrR family transcriptional regulator